MILLITGTREKLTKQQMNQMVIVLNAIKRQAVEAGDEISLIVNGKCPTGVDYYASLWAFYNGFPAAEFEAEWTRLGKSAGPIRNQIMVDYVKNWPTVIQCKLCVGFPKKNSIGTYDCMKRAEIAGIKTEKYLLLSDG